MRDELPVKELGPIHKTRSSTATSRSIAPPQLGNPEQDRGAGLLQQAFDGGGVALGAMPRRAAVQGPQGLPRSAMMAETHLGRGNFGYEAAPIRTRCGNPNRTTTPAMTEQTEPDAGRCLAAPSRGGEL